MKKASLLIIGVIYNTFEDADRYIRSIESAASADMLLILVDNSELPIPYSLSSRIALSPFIEYLKTGENLGYFHGAKFGLDNYLKQHHGYPEWIIVSNVDIVFTPDFFAKLHLIPLVDQPGVIAPSIISSLWKTDYNPKIQQRYTRKKLQFYLFIYSCFIFHNMFLLFAYLKKWLKGKPLIVGVTGQGKKPEKMNIYAPHGSCIIFRNNYFTRGGTLDLPNFLFGEEILVAETASRLKLYIQYDPELVVRDSEHASTGFFVSPKINRFNREAIRAVIDNYYKSKKVAK